MPPMSKTWTVGDSVTLLGLDGGDRISPQDWSTSLRIHPLGSALQLQASPAAGRDLTGPTNAWYAGGAAGEVAEWLKAAPC